MRQLHCSMRVSNKCTSPTPSSFYLYASVQRFHLWIIEAFSHDFYPIAIMVVKGSASKNSQYSGLTQHGTQKYFSLPLGQGGFEIRSAGSAEIFHHLLKLEQDLNCCQFDLFISNVPIDGLNFVSIRSLFEVLCVFSYLQRVLMELLSLMQQVEIHKVKATS